MISENKDDNINDVLISDNELDESKNNSNIKKAKFLKVSNNPFSTKIVKKSLNLNIESSKNISDLKKNLKKENNNDINEENKEKKENIHHIKSTTLNIQHSISQTSNPTSDNVSSINNFQTFLSNSKKKFSDNFYH